MLAPDEGCQAPSAGIKTALYRALGQHLPSPYRLGDAFQLLQTEIVEDEGGADQLPCQPADHHLVRPGQSFQTRGEVRRLAGDRADLPAAGGLDVADHDGAGSNPDMDMQ